MSNKLNTSLATPGHRSSLLELRACDSSYLVDTGGCEELEQAIRFVLRGWQIDPVADAGNDKPDFTFWRVEKGYNWKASGVDRMEAGLDECPETAVSAVFDLQYVLVDWLVEDNPGLAVVHAAAIETAYGLVMFPANVRAGKSFLTTGLGVRGYKIFADDVLALRPSTGEATALGILPRLRLPLPPQSSGPELRRAIFNGPNIADEDQMFADPQPGGVAPLGETARVHTIILPRRTNLPIAASLKPADRGSVLKALLCQNYSTSMLASDLFDAMDAMTAGVECFSLEYSNVDDAIACIDRFVRPLNAVA